MAGPFQNLRSTSESYVFQQVLRSDKGLSRRAGRERDPMAIQASQGVQQGATSTIMMAAILRGYNPGRELVEPVAPFLPVFESVFPTTCLQQGGEVITVTMEDTAHMFEMQLGSETLTDFIILSPTQVQATTVFTPVSGPVDIILMSLFGKITVSGQFNITSQAPIVQLITPAVGTYRGGTLVQIQVDSTLNVTGAIVGNSALTSFSIIDDTNVQGIVSAVANPQTVDVSVLNNFGTGTLPFGYAYQPDQPVVNSVSPSIAVYGTVVTIQGSGFLFSEQVELGFLGSGCFFADFTIIDDNNIEVLVPNPMFVGSFNTAQDVVVENGPFNGTGVSVFTMAQPSPLFANPSTGSVSGGDSVEILGNGFTGVTSIEFGSGNFASFTQPDDNHLEVASTPASTSGAVPVDIIITSPTGSSTISSGFTYS